MRLREVCSIDPTTCCPRPKWSVSVTCTPVRSMQHNARLRALLATILLASIPGALLALQASPRTREEHDVVIEEFSVATDGGPLVIPVSAGEGKKSLFVVDTASTFNAVDSSLRAELRTAGRGVPINGKSVQALYTAPGLSVGNAALPLHGQCVCLDFSGLRDASGEDLRGIVGTDFLRSYVLQVNVNSGRFALLKSIRRTSAVVLPLRYDKGCPIVDAVVGQYVSVAFMLDTGRFGRSRCVLERPLFDQLIAWGVLHPEPGMGTVVSPLGAQEYRRGVLDRLVIGGYAQHKIEVCDGDRNLLPLEAISMCRVTFDFPRDRLLLEPISRASGRLSEFVYFPSE